MLENTERAPAHFSESPYVAALAVALDDLRMDFFPPSTEGAANWTDAVHRMGAWFRTGQYTVPVRVMGTIEEKSYDVPVATTGESAAWKTDDQFAYMLCKNAVHLRHHGTARAWMVSMVIDAIGEVLQGWTTGDAPDGDDFGTIAFFLQNWAEHEIGREAFIQGVEETWRSWFQQSRPGKATPTRVQEHAFVYNQSVWVAAGQDELLWAARRKERLTMLAASIRAKIARGWTDAQVAASLLGSPDSDVEHLDEASDALADLWEE